MTRLCNWHIDLMAQLEPDVVVISLALCIGAGLLLARIGRVS